MLQLLALKSTGENERCRIHQESSRRRSHTLNPRRQTQEPPPKVEGDGPTQMGPETDRGLGDGSWAPESELGPCEQAKQAMEGGHHTASLN